MRNKFCAGSYHFEIINKNQIIISIKRDMTTRKQCEAYMQGLIDACGRMNIEFNFYQWQFMGDY